MAKIIQTAGRNALGEFAPEFAHYNDDVLFGENWNNQDIDVKTRSIITVVALMASGITDSSLKFHLQNAKAHGVTQKEIAAIITHVAFYAGWPKGWAVFNLAKEVWSVNEGDLPYEDEAMRAHAKEHGFTPFSTVENHYNLLYREDERELIPICRQMDVSLMPYSPLAAGHLTRPTWKTDTLRSKTDRVAMGKYDRMEEQDMQIVARVHELAEEFGVERMGIVGGSKINTAFLEAGLFDEISLLVGAGIDGRGGMPAVFDGLAMEHDVTKLKLIDVKKFDSDAVWIRYRC